MLVCIWPVTFCVGFIPMYLFSEVRSASRLHSLRDAQTPSCSPSHSYRQQFRAFKNNTNIIFTYIPIAVMISFSVVIVKTLHSQRRKLTPEVQPSGRSSRRSRKDRNASLQLLFIVFAFLLGNVPNCGKS